MVFFRLSQSNVKILTFVLLVGYSVPVIISCLLTDYAKGYRI